MAIKPLQKTNTRDGMNDSRISYGLAVALGWQEVYMGRNGAPAKVIVPASRRLRVHQRNFDYQDPVIFAAVGKRYGSFPTPILSQTSRIVSWEHHHFNPITKEYEYFVGAKPEIVVALVAIKVHEWEYFLDKNRVVSEESIALMADIPSELKEHYRAVKNDTIYDLY